MRKGLMLAVVLAVAVLTPGVAAESGKEKEKQTTTTTNSDPFVSNVTPPVSYSLGSGYYVPCGSC
ncbi:hypothetical protein DC3_43620 [Deinococcus cellulosilyticus NBRC 106333 = KACC 11606]|uniref:Uncharacterized protein n=1 Tax=Deinococcus cellulosilyticus (strain DSM 18568 / NBRC 106333 / KACC 11606 / 5516J-15) TaxID=1223518 RepID=A0A511N885_DEIC1|nr:hypothetical protein DC3_43620 [Deinococcus cellulosilyticus NBRC 106333 = KACC 11606]